MRGCGCGVLANENSCSHGAKINLGDLNPNLTYRVERRQEGRTKDDRIQHKIHWSRWFLYTDVSLSDKEDWRDIQREVESVENDWDNI
jgi:hypothetical protein